MTDTKDKRTVMICYDGSDHSKYALNFYAKNLHQPENKVLLVHCGQYVPFNYGNFSFLSGGYGMVEKIIREEEERIKGLMNEMEQQMTKLGFENGDIERLQGDVREEIISRAKHVDAKYIITGSRGMSKIRRSILGSVSDFLVHHAPAPVIVCKDPKHPV